MKGVRDWMIVPTFMTVLAGCAISRCIMDNSAKTTRHPPRILPRILWQNEISDKLISISVGSLLSVTGRVGNKMASSPLIHTVLTTPTLTGNGFYPHPLQFLSRTAVKLYSWAYHCSGSSGALPVSCLGVSRRGAAVSDQCDFFSEETWIFPNLDLSPDWENTMGQ